jgi:hypothetical protein
LAFYLHHRAALGLASFLVTSTGYSVAQGPSALSALPDAPGYVLQQSVSAPDTTGIVEGVITDVHGGLVPGAAITLELKGHSTQRDTVSDGEGHFQFSNVGPGTYELLITASELKTYLSPAFATQAGEHTTVPTIALAIATNNTTVDVSANSVEVAEEELKRETEQRIIGILPNFYTSFIYDAAPLNTRQKFKLTFKAVTDPTAVIGPLVVAGIEQERDTFPSWGNDDAASYGKRFAAAYGDELLSRVFSYAVFPAVFRQDPRYFYMGPSQKTSTRFWHAALAGIIIRGDNGRDQPNYSHMLGSASAGAISSVYHPASDGAGYLAGVNLGVGIAGHGVQALIREFIWPRLTTHVPAYEKGKVAPAPAQTPPAKSQ